jgi:hypothetical protein
VLMHIRAWPVVAEESLATNQPQISFALAEKWLCR